MAPLVKALEKDARFCSKVAVTGQHREMLDQVLKVFNIIPEYDLNIMKQGQTLPNLTTKILDGMTLILEKEKPDIVLVHGDTVTTMASTIAAFYQKIKVGHVEAGLRTRNKWSPFPEEINRQVTDVISDIYFAPTFESKKNLLEENHPEDAIFVTGNTAIDAMQYTISKKYQHKDLPKKNEKMILVTMHRRENLGVPMRKVFRGIARVAKHYPAIQIVFPMHRNPSVRKDAREILEKIRNIHLIEPLEVVDFHNFAAKSFLILTDSGGVQEEAPSLGVPVLVLRDTTERPEGVAAGTLKLIGTEEDSIFKETIRLIEDEEKYNSMARASNPYGDGKASIRILESLASYFHCVDKSLETSKEILFP